jgi:hypothetical protein
MDGPEVTWDEIDRAEAAVAAWAKRWELPLNPEDCEAIAASAVVAARSTWSREHIYKVTEEAITKHEELIVHQQSPRTIDEP